MISLILPHIRKGDYIYGSFLKPEITNGYIKNTNPAQLNASLGRYVFSLSSVGQALAYAKVIQPNWAKYTLDFRLEPIIRLHQIIAKKHKHLIHTISLESGCSLKEANFEINESLLPLRSRVLR